MNSCIYVIQYANSNIPYICTCFHTISTWKASATYCTISGMTVNVMHVAGPTNSANMAQYFIGLPSGKQPHNYGKSQFSCWVNPLFPWPFSIAMLVYQRVCSHT